MRGSETDSSQKTAAVFASHILANVSVATCVLFVVSFIVRTAGSRPHASFESFYCRGLKIRMARTMGMAILVKSLKKAGALVSSSDSHQLRSGYVTLKPGGEVGEHETGGGEEIIVFIDGTAEVSSYGETKTVHAPAVVLVPAHTSHNVRNKSDAPLHYVYVYVMAMDGA